jgi:hypothetical protein
MEVQSYTEHQKRATQRRPIAMNAPNLPLLPEGQLAPQPADQPNLELASEGVQRYVWHSAYGAMLIEVREGSAYINGRRVVSMQELRSADTNGVGVPTAARSLSTE